MLKKQKMVQTHLAINQKEGKRRKTIVVSVEQIGHKDIHVKTCDYATIKLWMKGK